MFPEVAGQAAAGVAYAKALRHVLELDDVPPPIADQAGPGVPAAGHEPVPAADGLQP